MKLFLVFIFAYLKVYLLYLYGKHHLDHFYDKVTSSTTPILNTLEQSCVDDLSLNQGVIERWNSERIVPENNQQFNKFMACYWRKKNYMDEEGNVSFDTLQLWLQNLLKVKLNESRAIVVAENAISVCKRIRKSYSDGATVTRISNCIIRNVSESSKTT